ncbi:hypothetical protein ROA7450_02230 [Roseovarius albus]|uniref:DUF4381 domain-containing protein n=1 Tax=Roseovarius albus TaxID=1247867 RepID=A0A1X6ZAF7_9RHOB|nr:DUF4381 domain-containing protein [Roseovarius albus]SLN45804.1 hypothetical protein ROA7450_02230 [Roseovarius albus]
MSSELEGLSLVELIDLLEEAPQPAAIAMTPQTPGWLVLGAACLVVAVWLSRHLIRKKRANAYRRAALQALDKAADDPAQIATILKQTALVGYPRKRVASLSGSEWLAFLDGSFPGSGFAKGAGKTLTTAPYSDSAAAPELSTLARKWVREHRPERDV